MSTSRVTAGDVISCLKVRFEAPAFAFLEQVADATGARHRRWADAVAMSVWPSRGYDIHGIEVKVSRYDWQKELAQPEKSAAVQQYCNRWWIATPDQSLIHPGELPSTWGWMVMNGKGGMKVLVEAPALSPATPSVEFIASILRNTATAEEAKIAQRIKKAEDAARESATSYHQSRYVELKKTVDEFSASSGIDLNHCWDAGNVGEAVNTLRRLSDRTEQINSAISACADIQGMLEKVQAFANLKREVTA